MAENTIKMRIQNRYDTSSNWTENNPVLKSGELGFDEKGRAKVGDGIHTWTQLNYINEITMLTAINDNGVEENTFTILPNIEDRVYYFVITKDTTLNFVNSSNTMFFIEKRIYLENAGPNEITLSLGGFAEWANDAYNGAEWGKPGMHLYLQATWIGGRIIVEVIDNDQLADDIVS